MQKGECSLGLQIVGSKSKGEEQTSQVLLSRKLHHV